MILNKRTIYTIGCLILITIFTISWLKINKRVTPTQKLKEVATLNTEIVANMQNSNFLSLEKYIEKPLVLKGNIQQISYDKSYNLMILNKDSIWISCEFQKDQNEILKQYTKGDHIKIKGIYKGALNYLVLLNCIIEN